MPGNPNRTHPPPHRSLHECPTVLSKPSLSQLHGTETRMLVKLTFRGRILGRNWDKSLKSFPPCYSQSPLPTDFTPLPHSLEQKWLKLVCNVNIVHGSLKAENSQDYAQKPQQNCTFMNSASGCSRVLSGPHCPT